MRFDGFSLARFGIGLAARLVLHQAYVAYLCVSLKQPDRNGRRIEDEKPDEYYVDGATDAVLHPAVRADDLAVASA